MKLINYILASHRGELLLSTNRMCTCILDVMLLNYSDMRSGARENEKTRAREHTPEWFIHTQCDCVRLSLGYGSNPHIHEITVSCVIEFIELLNIFHVTQARLSNFFSFLLLSAITYNSETFDLFLPSRLIFIRMNKNEANWCRRDDVPISFRTNCFSRTYSGT